MKTFFATILTFFMTVAVITAQVKISEDTISMSQGLTNGYSLELPNTTPKNLEKKWAKHLKQFKSKKTKYNKKTGEYFTDNAKIKQMSSNTVDIYTILAPVRGGTRLMVCFDLGGSFLSTRLHPTSSKIGQQILYDFGIQIKKEQSKENIVNQEKQLKTLESDMKKLKKGEDDIRKSIEELKAKIAKLEEQVKNSKNAQSNKLNEIKEQKQAILKAKKDFDNIK